MSTPNHGGVNGFLERGDGSVWAYGGTDHMGLGQSFVVRVDGSEPVTLFSGRGPPLVGPSGRDSAATTLIGPGASILQLLELDGSLVAFTYKEAFRVDTGFGAWHRLFAAQARPWPHLSTPQVLWPNLRRVHPVGPGKFLLATERAGYLLLQGAQETPLTVSHQLGLERVQSIVPAGPEVLFYAAPWEPPWRRTSLGFEQLDLRPPAPGTSNGSDSPRGWTSSAVVPGRAGELVSFTREGGSRSRTLLMARWRGSRPSNVTELTSEVSSEVLFFTPDGELWNAGGGLFRLVGNRWEKGRLETDPRSRRGVLHARALETRGPAYWIHDSVGRRLYLLSRETRLGDGATPTEAKMAVVDLREGGVRLEVLAAEPWADWLLLATPAGLRILSVGDDVTVMLSPAPFSLPAAATITRLARDGRGRLWLGGRGLWILPRTGALPMSLDESLPLRDAVVGALGRNPSDSNQMVVAFQGRGVMAISLGEPRR